MIEFLVDVKLNNQEFFRSLIEFDLDKALEYIFQRIHIKKTFTQFSWTFTEQIFSRIDLNGM